MASSAIAALARDTVEHLIDASDLFEGQRIPPLNVLYVFWTNSTVVVVLATYAIARGPANSPATQALTVQLEALRVPAIATLGHILIAADGHCTLNICQR